MSFFSQSTSVSSVSGKDELPPEPLTEYYEDRKKIIFKKLTISKNEEYILSLVKKKQKVINELTPKYVKDGFFLSVPEKIYQFCLSLKENIANYCLVIALYFQENRKMDAMRLFLLLCEQNKRALKYLSYKVLDQVPRISNRNKIAKFYPTITKILLKIYSVYIKLAGKFNKSVLENYYIVEYLKIVHIISITVVKYINPGKIDEISNQLKNERRYFYSNCLFDCSIYLFNRFQPFRIPISILSHIIDLYNMNMNYLLNELESTLLLKVNYNLSLFYYMDGLNAEAINILNQAKERLSDIKYFPISKTRKSRISLNEEELMKNKLRANNNNISNSSTLLLDFNDVIIPQVNHSSRNKYKRSSIKPGTHLLNERDSIEQQSSLFMKGSSESIKSNIKKNFKMYSTIYLGAYNLLRFKNPIELELVRDKISIEIELFLSEIELKNKNYKEALNHLNYILNLQKKAIVADNNIFNKESIRLTKSKTNSTQNEMETFDNFNIINKTNDKSRFFLNYKKNLNENNSNTLFLFSRDKSSNNILKETLSLNNNNSNNKDLNHSQIMKYHLTNGDKSRIMRLLEEIEIASLESNQNISKNKTQYQEEAKYPYDRSKNYLIRNQKIITSKEMEKFFIFICGLSIYQLKILNDTQPPPSRRRNDLPIIFNNQFQDCLTNSQRMNLSSLETMSLSRYILLKDTNKDISLDNLDYRFMLYRIKDEESEDEKNKNNNFNKKRLKKNNNSIFRRNKNSKFSFRSNTFYVKGSKKNVKKYEYEEEDSAIKFFMKNNKKNKKLINLHKKGITKLFEEMNNDEQKIFYKNPELLGTLIENTEKDMKK